SQTALQIFSWTADTDGDIPRTDFPPYGCSSIFFVRPASRQHSPLRCPYCPSSETHVPGWSLPEECILLMSEFSPMEDIPPDKSHFPPGSGSAHIRTGPVSLWDMSS